MVVTLAQLKTNPGKYFELAEAEEVIVTKRGKPIGKILSEIDMRVEAAKSIIGSFPADVDVDELYRNRHEYRFADYMALEE